MKYACLIVLVSVGCASSPKVVINNQQDFENVVVEVIKEVIEIFNAAGINCTMINTDLKAVKSSQKVAAAKEWSKTHPDAKAAVAPKVEEHRAELEKASAPGVRQCNVQLKAVFDDISQ